MEIPTAASAELELLNPFVGVWTTEGEMKMTAPERSSKFLATDTYEWLPGGHFLLHRFDADMPEGRIQGIEVIGYSGESVSFHMHAFDSTGNANVMEARVENETWTFVGDATRFTGSFRDDGKIFAGRWESRSVEDASWQPLMDVTLRRGE